MLKLPYKVTIAIYGELLTSMEIIYLYGSKTITICCKIVQTL